jgi:hypothetical protein
MITQEQIKRVHALVDKWGITDPIKQHAKMGEEINEYLKAWFMSNHSEMEKEMGDMWFTLIAISKQLKIDFWSYYEACYIMNRIEVDKFSNWFVSVVSFHLGFAESIMKQKDIQEDFITIVSIWLDGCRYLGIDEYETLEFALIKNENKTGKTVNGTFIKTSDL